MNILWIFTDQHHADAMSFMGHPVVKTPNLDRLAARGAWFRNMYTCSAICAPSRTSYYTGTYLRTHNHFMNQGDLQRDLPSLLSICNDAGYLTGMCGKCHLPHTIERHFGWIQSSDDYAIEAGEKGWKEEHGADWHQKFMSAPSTIPTEGHKITWTGDKAVEFLDMARDDARPFVFWCSFGPPHAPHNPPAEFDDMYAADRIGIDWDEYERFERSRVGQRAMIEDFWKVGSVRQEPQIFQKAVCRYLTLISLVDAQIGRILARLEELGLADDTIVAFSADHGDFAGHFGQLGKNIPGYDDLLRIPFIWYDPRRVDAGRCVESLYQNVDFLPSVLERLGLDIPHTVQGQSFLPALDGYPESGREAIFAETSNVKTIRTHEWKLNFFAVHPERGQLFRMGAQPNETENLWDVLACESVKTRLLLRLAEWMVRCEQPDSMSIKTERHVDTRWYKWLAQQPHEAEDQEHPRNRG